MEKNLNASGCNSLPKIKIHLTILILSYIFLIPVFFQWSSSFAQTKSSQNSDSTVTFTATFDIQSATKDGYYLNGYVVDIDFDLAGKINGKKIRVSGVVTIVKGLDNQPAEYDKDGNKIVRQGRSQDSKHIENPRIEILN